MKDSKDDKPYSFHFCGPEERMHWPPLEKINLDRALSVHLNLYATTMLFRHWADLPVKGTYKPNKFIECDTREFISQMPRRYRSSIAKSPSNYFTLQVDSHLEVEAGRLSMEAGDYEARSF